jgi:hypothetical protein
MDRIRVKRACLAGIAGSAVGLAVYQGLVPFVARFTLDPRRQSADLMSVLRILLSHPPAGAHLIASAVVWLVVFGSVYGILFALTAANLPGSGWRKGLSFGVLIWILSYGFFEFLSPWTQFSEPLPLLALELTMWLVVALAEGIVIAATMRTRTTENASLRERKAA